MKLLSASLLVVALLGVTYVAIIFEYIPAVAQTFSTTILVQPAIGCRIDTNCYDANPCTLDLCEGGKCIYSPAEGDPCVTSTDGERGFCSGSDCLLSSADPVSFSTSDAIRFADSFTNTRNNSVGSFCPDRSPWIEQMRLASPSPNKIVFNFGCNKGYDALYFLTMWDDTSSPFNRTEWYNAQKSKSRRWPCRRPTPEELVTVPLRTSNHTERSPLVFCLEPLLPNVDLLVETSELLGYDKPHGGHYPTALRIHGNAASDVADEILQFPAGKDAGIEHIGYMPGKEPSNVTDSVRSVTVDSLAESFNIERVDMLLVDTEGHDPAVLRGAEKVLENVRYIEFERHRIGLWAKTKLSDVISHLDEHQFDCCWQGIGKLWPITGAWDDRYDEFKKWSNIACVKRGDVWHKILFEFLHKLDQ